MNQLVAKFFEAVTRKRMKDIAKLPEGKTYYWWSNPWHSCTILSWRNKPIRVMVFSIGWEAPQLGDYIIFAMDSGGFGKTQVFAMRRPSDPGDQYFLDLEPVEYVSKEDLEIPPPVWGEGDVFNDM